jgi:hypothetical protein
VNSIGANHVTLQKRREIMKGRIPPVKPGQKTTESGIYKDTKDGRRTTLDKGEKAPPTSSPGAKWKVEIPTDPKKR